IAGSPRCLSTSELRRGDSAFGLLESDCRRRDDSCRSQVSTFEIAGCCGDQPDICELIPSAPDSIARSVRICLLPKRIPESQVETRCGPLSGLPTHPARPYLQAVARICPP